jgi:hypothetical protein
MVGMHRPCRGRTTSLIQLRPNAFADNHDFGS